MNGTTLKKGLLTSFFEGYDAVEPVWDRIATKVPSTAREETYGWLGSIPRLKEMKGERVPDKLKDYEYTLKNKEYEASIEVRRADLKDDQTGKFAPLVRSIGEASRLYPDELIFGNLLPNGFSQLAYDGQYYFDTDHPIGDLGTVQSNKLALDLDAANFQTARTMLMSMKDDFGRPINLNPKLLLVIPVDLLATAQGILEVERLANGASNTNYKAAEILVSPWITDADSWFLLNMNGVVKPFILQEREFIPFEALEEGSDTAWWRKIFYYGTYWRGNAGYGLYQKAVGSTGA
jgi:phage major head subunit gpT-like protein